MYLLAHHHHEMKCWRPIKYMYLLIIRTFFFSLTKHDHGNHRFVVSEVSEEKKLYYYSLYNLLYNLYIMENRK